MNLPTWLLILIATASWGIWGICDKLALRGMRSIQIVLVSGAVTAGLLPFYAYMERSQRLPPMTPKALFWCALGSIATAVAFLAFLAALNRKDTTEVVGLTAAYPAITFLLAVLFLGEKVTAGRSLGLVMVLFGVWLISR